VLGVRVTEQLDFRECDLAKEANDVQRKVIVGGDGDGHIAVSL
jgi:hypothetical protein